MATTSPNIPEHSPCHVDKSPNSPWNKHFNWPKENKIDQNIKRKILITSKKWKDIQVEKENLKKEKESILEKKRNA